MKGDIFSCFLSRVSQRLSFPSLSEAGSEQSPVSGWCLGVGTATPVDTRVRLVMVPPLGVSLSRVIKVCKLPHNCCWACPEGA